MTIREMNERKRELGYSYEKISELSGVPLSTVRKVLGEITKAPRFATLESLRQVLQLPGEHAAGLTGTPGKERQGVRYDDEPAGKAGTVAETAPAYRVEKRQGEYTLEDYLALPDDRRVELIDGVIYDMSAPTGYHQLIAGQIYARLLAYISGKKGKSLPFISPVDVQLDCDDRTIVQPDVLILCDPSKYTPARIVGAPDFVVEIISPSTKAKDMFLKNCKYRDAGVREYWIVDPKKKTIFTYHYEEDDDHAIYRFRDMVPVGIYGGDLQIDFSEIDDYVTPWM